MKKYMYTPVLVMLLTAFTTLRAQEEYLGLPGDNLNLYAVMKLFQESETLEGFERNLNDENSRINNLDLDGDGYVDYIRVIDNIDRNVHYIVLQVAVNRYENQDVAVFNVLKEANGQVQIQLIGDEELYGRNYIIEPIFDETPNPGYIGNNRAVYSQPVVVSRTTTFEIAAWPVVRFIFLPTYVVWHSPWYYSYYPSYWRSWNSYYWHYYHGYHYNYYSYYYGHYRPWNDYRNPYWQVSYYSSRRSISPNVKSRIQEGHYKTTYSHPEKRSEGVALYEKTRRDQNVRTSEKSTGGTAVRRTTTESGNGGRQATSTGTSRRTTATGTSRQTNNTDTKKQTTTQGTVRQSTGTGSDRQSTTVRTNRQTTTTGTSTKSTSSGVSNANRRQSAGQTTVKTGTSNKSTSTGVSNSSRRSSGSNKTATSGNKTESTKSTSSSGNGRR